MQLSKVLYHDRSAHVNSLDDVSTKNSWFHVVLFGERVSDRSRSECVMGNRFSNHCEMEAGKALFG